MGVGMFGGTFFWDILWFLDPSLIFQYTPTNLIIVTTHCCYSPKKIIRKFLVIRPIDNRIRCPQPVLLKLHTAWGHSAWPIFFANILSPAKFENSSVGICDQNAVDASDIHVQAHHIYERQKCCHKPPRDFIYFGTLIADWFGAGVGSQFQMDCFFPLSP